MDRRAGSRCPAQGRRYGSAVRGIAIFRPEARPATATGAQARGAAAIGALAVGAAAVGGFAIGRLSVGRLAIGRRGSAGSRSRSSRSAGFAIREGQPTDSLEAGPGVIAAAVSSASPPPLRPMRRRPLPRPRRLPGLPGAAAGPLPPRAVASEPGRLEPGHLEGAGRGRTRRRRSPTSTATAATSSTPTSARRAPMASPTRWSALASANLPIHYTAYGDESDPGPFPIPAGAPVEGGSGSDGDRHVLVVDRASCTLYELYRAFPKPAADRTGTLTPAPAGTSARRALGPTPGPPPTPPGCRSSPASSATTRPPPAKSTTRSGSPSTAPATPGSTPPRTAPATPDPRRAGDGDAAAAARPATASAASAGRRRRSPSR